MNSTQDAPIGNREIVAKEDNAKPNPHYSIDYSFKSIKEWSSDDRPREKLASKGAHVLSDSELMAILVSTGTKNLSAIDCSRMLLNKYGGLDELSKRNIGELKSVKGIGEAKAITLMAAFEIARRIKPKKFDSSKVINSPDDVARMYIPRFKDDLQESFWVLHLSSANIVIKEKLITRGLLNSSLVHPREVFRDAITEAAAAVILMHNHPSGNPKPSNSDIAVTQQLKSAGNLIDIKVLDHIIIAGDSFTSLVVTGQF